jgi:hypothetical protein
MKMGGQGYKSLRVSAAVIGTLCGISGLEHGFFEILQGNVAPKGLLIQAIGEANRFWPNGIETAFTLVPSFFTSGLLAIFFSILVIVWSVFFIQKKHGWLVYLFLSTCQFLTGGGFAQIFLTVALGLTAGRFGKPLNWWRRSVPESVRRFLSVLWAASLAVFALLFFITVGLAVFGYIPGIRDTNLVMKVLVNTSYLMLVFFALSLIAALARDSLGIKTNFKS